jgi:alpha-L-fucosidase
MLKQMGEWTRQYGETIYGTRGGPLSPRDWGVTTQKGNKIYVHILKWQDETLTLPRLGKKVVSAKIFIDKTPVKFLENDFGLTLKVPKDKMNDFDTVVELELK